MNSFHKQTHSVTIGSVQAASSEVAFLQRIILREIFYMGRYKKTDRNITKMLATEIIRLLKERPTFTP